MDFFFTMLTSKCHLLPFGYFLNLFFPVVFVFLLPFNRIAEHSIESFVIKIYRENNPKGFIKAFSEEPELLTLSFSKVEKLLKTLYLTKLYLWPRFRLEIAKALESSIQPDVNEFSLSLTQNMKTIQNSILVAMDKCLIELKKSSPMINLYAGENNSSSITPSSSSSSSSSSAIADGNDVSKKSEDSTVSSSYFTLENCLFSSFDNILKNQLDPDWYKLSFKTKQIISDITTLRKLLDYLVRYDCFSFYYLLTKIQLASNDQKSPSLWLMSEAGNQIFKHAKERLYKVISINDQACSLNRITSKSRYRCF
jgi:DNA excision repair protein ERCC-4